MGKLHVTTFIGVFKIKRFTFIILLVTSMFAVIGCSNSSDENTVPDQEDNNTLTIAVPSDMGSLDIHNHNGTLTESIHSNMFNYLFKRNKDGEIKPELVDEYDNLDDYTWEFTLKEGVTFHNGTELTAEDVKFTLERVAGDESLSEYWFYRQIKEVVVMDDYTFQIVTHEPEPVLLNRLSRIGSAILPKEYIEENGWDHFYEEPIGTGPFKFVDWKKDQEIVFEVYPDYYEGDVTDWEKLVFRVIPEESTRVAELLTGGVDLAMNMPNHEFDRINDNEGTSISTIASQRVAGLLIRHNEEYATSDPRVREAIELAIDNKVLTEDVLGGAGTPTRTRVTPGNTGANEDLYDTYLYDPEKAKELLEEAGYGDGLEITIHGPNGRYAKDRDIQEMIAGMLSKVGITVNTDLLEWSNFVDLRNAYAYDEAYFIAYGNSLFDAALAVSNLASDGALETHGYKNDELDELIAAAETNMDPVERDEQYYRIQEIIANERPYIYLYAESANYGVNDRIDFTPRSDEMLFAQDILKK